MPGAFEQHLLQRFYRSHTDLVIKYAQWLFRNIPSHLSVLSDLCYRLVSRKEKNGDFLSSAQSCSSRRLRAEKPGTQLCSTGTQSPAHSPAALWARRLYLWVASLEKILIDFTISVYAHACIYAVTCVPWHSMEARRQLSGECSLPTPWALGLEAARLARQACFIYC